MPRGYFKCYHSFSHMMEMLTLEEKGRLFEACLSYSESGEMPDLCGNERFVFPSMKMWIDNDESCYQAKCEKNRENINKRWNTAVYDGIQTNTNDTKDKYKDKEKEKDNNISTKVDIVEKPQKRFVKPTTEEIQAYCDERKNGIDAVKFYDYYEARGWMLNGKTHIKDWKACVRTWERSGYNSVSSAPKRKDSLSLDYTHTTSDVDLLESILKGQQAV